MINQEPLKHVAVLAIIKIPKLLAYDQDPNISWESLRCKHLMDFQNWNFWEPNDLFESIRTPKSGIQGLQILELSSSHPFTIDR